MSNRRQQPVARTPGTAWPGLPRSRPQTTLVNNENVTETVGNRVSAKTGDTKKDQMGNSKTAKRNNPTSKFGRQAQGQN